MKKVWEIARWPVIGFLILFVLALIFSAAIINYAVNNYTEEYTGRKITVKDVGFNLFNGNIHLDGLNIKETDGVTDFVNVERIKLDMSIYRVWVGDIQLTSFDVIRPEVHIIQNDASFNFSDLIEKFASDTSQNDLGDSEPIWFEMDDLNIEHGHITYRSPLIHEDLIINDLNINVDTIASYRSAINALVNMEIGWGGKIDVALNIEQADSTYSARIRTDEMALDVFKPYVLPYLDISALKGEFYSDLTIFGNINDNMDLTMHGKMGVQNFELQGPKDVTLTSVKNCSISIDNINVKEEEFQINSVMIDSPFLLFEIYEEGDNFSNLLVNDSMEVDEDDLTLGYDSDNPFSMLAHYLNEVLNGYEDGSFRLDSLGLFNGSIIYNDYSLFDQFVYELTDMSITSFDINSKEKMFEIDASAVLNETGSFEAELKLDPNSTRDMTLTYSIEGITMPNFGPYSIFYTALPILSGNTKYTCHTVINDNKLTSNNKIFVEDLQYGKKHNVNNLFDLPLKFAVSLLKDVDGNIDLEIPVEGDLDDPEYKLGKVIWAVLKNIVLKVVSSPYKLLANTFGANEEDLRAVYFLYLQNELTSQQTKPLNLMAKVLLNKPEMFVELIQTGDKDIEMKKYAVFMAKKEYYESANHVHLDILDPEDQQKIIGIETKNLEFSLFLTKELGITSTTLPVQVKCEKLIGDDAMRTGVHERWALRNTLMNDYLINNKKLDQTAFLVRDVTAQDTIASAGPPKYHVIYSVHE